MASSQRTRREFIVGAGKSAVALALFSPLAGVGVSIAGKAPKSIGTTHLDLGMPEYQALTEVGGALKVPNPTDKKKPIIVTRLSETNFAAFSSRCTHYGCELPLPVNKVITCPCHHAQYDMTGRVTHGPAKKNLPKFAATLSGNILTITDLPATK